MGNNNNFTTLGSSALQLDEFANHLSTFDYSPKTLECYIDGIRDYHRHGFSEISLQNEYKYREMLIKEGKKARTINARIHALNTYNKWLGLPIIKLMRINEDPFVQNAMEITDFHRLVDNLLTDGKYCWYIAIKLLASTGMRIGEAVGVTYGDFRRGTCTVFGKGGKERTVFFSHSLRETLFLYTKDKPDNERMIPYNPHYVREALRRVKQRYGLHCNASPHEYRRFFAREMYDATQDMALVKGLLGHENMATTSHYVRKTENQALRMFARSQNW